MKDSIVDEIRKRAKHSSHLGPIEECVHCVMGLEDSEPAVEEPIEADPVKARLSRILGDE